MPGINAELIDTGWSLSQNINGVTGGIHIVEEVNRQGREGKHQQPQHSQDICHHYERGAEAAATHGAPELSKGLLGSARGVESLSQKHDAVEEEKGGQTIDDILEILNNVSKGYVVLKVTGKVCFDDSLRLCERLVPTTTEEGDARETQERGDQGAVWHSTQTAHTAVVATHVWRMRSGTC